MKTKRFFISVFCVLTTILLLAPSVIRAEPTVLGATTGKIAVTPPDFDDIGAVLEGLGFAYDEIQFEELKSEEKLKEYDVVYINCSSDADYVAEEAGPAIASYVKGGGIVYASDYANSIIIEAFPGKINFYSDREYYDEDEATDYYSSRIGEVGVVQAQIVDPGLASVIGKSTIEINYDMGSWVVMDSPGSGTKVHMTGPVSLGYGGEEGTLQDKPYVVSFSEGDGEVLYTSFHNEAQVSSDVQSVLNWFAVRAKGGKIARKAQELATQGGDQVLQEIVDGIDQGEEKIYYFNATGEEDFSVILNFDGSAVSLAITDPNGNAIITKEVSSPPFSQKITAEKGKYTIEVKGEDIPYQNMPFVLTVGGPEKAAADPIIGGTPTKSKSKKIWVILGVIVGLFLLFVIVVIVVIVILLKRRKKAKSN